MAQPSRWLSRRRTDDHARSLVLQKCLPNSLSHMHALRERALLHAVEALLHGRRLTLMDVARAWTDTTCIRAPRKTFDRLLSNRHLHASAPQSIRKWRVGCCAARSPQPAARSR